MRYQPLDTLSILTMYLLTVLLFFVAIEVGYRVNRRFRLRSPDKSDVSLGGTVGASMALVAFLVALVVSFGMGISAERRHLMVAEANPILLALFALFLAGVHSGDSQERNYFAPIVLVLIMSVAFVMIVDLDRANEGLFVINQQAMIDLQRQLNNPAVNDEWQRVHRQNQVGAD